MQFFFYFRNASLAYCENLLRNWGISGICLSYCVKVSFNFDADLTSELLFKSSVPRCKLLPFLRQFLFTDKLVSWDRPAGRSQETKRPSGIFPPAFYIPIPDGAFPYYNTSYTPLFCDINPNRYQTAQDRSSRT